LVSLLVADQFADRRVELVLGVVALIALTLACTQKSTEQRACVLFVVIAASCFEVLGSIIWGVYRYRLGNLPLFVPPSHGLVYLAGVAISELEIVRRWSLRFVQLVVALAIVWGGFGLTGILGRIDLIGAFGVLVFVSFVIHGRLPTVLCGVFLVVAALEVLGTMIGTWRWAASVPGLHVPNGNPPSGVASGYTLFDLIAVVLVSYSTRLLRSSPD
jgi:hypothetical protein